MSSLHGGIVLLMLSVIIQLVILEVVLTILEAVVLLWIALCIREHLLLVLTIDISIVIIERVLVLLIVFLSGFPILSMCKFVMHSIFYLGTDSTH